MKNVSQINDIKDYAELALASYGYFDLVVNQFDENVTQSVKEVKINYV